MQDVQTTRAGKNEVEIDLRPLLKALWKKLWLLILIGVLVGGGAFVGARLFITPTYRSSFTAYVNNSSDQSSNTSISNSDLSASQSLTNTYAAIITSRGILEQAAEAAGLNLSYTELSDIVSTSTVSNTEILCVSVTMEDPALAMLLAQAIADVTPDYVSEIVEGSSMQIVDEPVLPENRYSPSYSRILIIGFLIGFLVTAAVIVIRELVDNRVKDSDSLESRYGIPIIGTIPSLEAAQKSSSRYGYGYSSAARRKE